MTKRLFQPLDVIYDGQCAFCIRSLRVVRRLDTFKRLRFYDAHDHETVDTKFPMVNREDTNDAMYAVTSRGESFRGFYAFRQIMWCSPWTLPFLVGFYLPGASFFGARLYAWVARNRRKLGCSATTCEVRPLAKRADEAASRVKRSL